MADKKSLETPCRLTNRDMGLDSPAHSAQNSPRCVRHLSEDDRNPEPPVELFTDHPELIQADTIGDTAFSRQWLFSTLMALIKAVEGTSRSQDSTPAKETTTDDSDGVHDGVDGAVVPVDSAVSTENTNTSASAAGVVEGGLDIDDNLQDELCKLWDMAMNAEVVKFLQEFKSVELFTGVIAKSKAPRATEICVGILGNMACNKNAAEEISNSPHLIKLILLLLEDPDAPTLIETTRLIHVCISDNSVSCATSWIEAIKTSETTLKSLMFILNSSTNNELLCNGCLLLDKLLDMDDDLCVSYSCTELILALLEAVKQCGYKTREPIDTVLHLLQLMSTNDTGVKALVDVSEVIHDFVLLQYIFHQCSQMQVDITDYENSLASAISILHVILKNTPGAENLFFKDFQLIRCCLKLLEAVYPQVEGHSSYDVHLGRRRSRTMSNGESHPQDPVDNHEESGDSSDVLNASVNASIVVENEAGKQASNGDAGKSCSSIRGPRSTRTPYIVQTTNHVDTTEMNRLLFKTLRGIIVEILTHQCGAIPQNGPEGSPVTRSIAPVWDYLDKSCTRSRLHYMIWTLNVQQSSQSTLPPSNNNSPAPSNQSPAPNSESLCTRLHQIAENYSLSRLASVLTDINTS